MIVLVFRQKKSIQCFIITQLTSINRNETVCQKKERTTQLNFEKGRSITQLKIDVYDTFQL